MKQVFCKKVFSTAASLISATLLKSKLVQLFSTFFKTSIEALFWGTRLVGYF